MHRMVIILLSKGYCPKKKKRHSYQEVNESLGKRNGVPVIIPIFMETEALSIRACFQGSHYETTPSGWFGSFLWYPRVVQGNKVLC